ncbi:PD-(D/E)XK nuclease family transposase, partial [Oceanospirillum sediminis]
RDQQIPAVVLSDQLQLNIIELKKADRLATDSESLKAWITFFEHWQEDALMFNITHEPVKQAIGRIRELSADEEEKRLAFVRERALHDEATLIVEAKEEGYKQAQAEAQEEKRIGIATLLKLGLADKQIAEALQVTEEQVQKARDEFLH